MGLVDSFNCLPYDSRMKTVLNVKTDKEVKEEARKAAAELGLPLSTIVNAYLKQFVRDKEVYFSAGPRMSGELEALLSEIDADIEKGRNLSPVFASPTDLESYLNHL